MNNQQSILKSTPFVQIRDRESFIELFRWILTFFVYGEHTMGFVGGADSWLKPNLDLIFVTSVPLFCLISGFFTVTSEKSHFVRFICNFFIFYIFNIVLVSITFAIYGWDVHNGTNALIGALECGGNWWYMTTIMFVYLFGPILNIILNKSNKYLSLVLGVILIILASLEFNKMVDIEYKWVTARQLLWCMGLWIIGSWLRQYGGSFIRGSKSKFSYIIGCSLILVFLVITNSLYAFDPNVYTGVWFAGSDLLVAFYAIVIFIIVINIQIKSNKFCNLLGMCSMTNYLFSVVGQVVIWYVLLPLLNTTNQYFIFLFGTFGLFVFMTCLSLILIWFVDYFCRLLYQYVSFVINKIMYKIKNKHDKIKC